MVLGFSGLDAVNQDLDLVPIAIGRFFQGLDWITVFQDWTGPDGYRDWFFGYLRKEKRKLIDTGFGISLGIGRYWFFGGYRTID